MTGITSYGAYVPFYRLSRAVIAKSWGAGEVPGEKAVAYYDEDSLTMAVAAALDCIKGIDPESIGGLYFASTTSPYKEKQSAATIATVLGLPKSAFTVDFSGSLRSGTNAVRAAVDAVNSGSVRSVLVCASDVRLGCPNGANEMALGDGAAAFLIGKTDVVAELEDSYTTYEEIQDVWRSDRDFFVRTTEDRFSQEAYTRVVKEAVTNVLKKSNLTPKDFTKAVVYAPNARWISGIVRSLGFDLKSQIQDSLYSTVGDTGSAMSLMCLVSALEETKAGNRILLSNYGNGCDVFVLKVTDGIEKVRERRGIKKHLAEKKMIPTYNKYLRWRELIDIEPPARPSLEFVKPTPAAQWRENEGVFRLRGTRCKRCGTPQYPPQRVCVSCGTKDELEYYSFAEKRGKIFSFCHDYVTASPDPPISVTMVDFEGGGRIMIEMTDRDPAETRVGMPVEMTFRKLYYVDGIYNYWWKCKPAMA